MTKDEARKLLSGYATGSLTEAERKALMEAALEDQGLFDELAEEIALKEVLDEPGARQRLLAALEPPRHRAWIWGWAGAAATLAIVIGIVVFPRQTPPPQQVAQVLRSPEPVAVEAPQPSPPSPPAPVRRKAAPVPLPGPPVGLKKEEKRADQLQEAKPQAAGAVREFASAALAPAVFAFRYSIGADGFLEITPAASGFLSVTANGTAIFPSRAVNPGAPVRIPIPAESASLVIGFSATPGITGAPVRREEASGTVTDQDPPNGRIVIQFFLTPAPR